MVDDASTDNGRNIVKTHDFPALRLYSLATNSGPGFESRGRSLESLERLVDLNSISLGTVISSLVSESVRSEIVAQTNFH